MVARRVLCLLCAALIQMAMPVEAATPQISAGAADGFVVLDAHGVVWTTGAAQVANTSMPVRMSIADAKSVSMGSSTSWIIRADDSLWGAGSNNYGELGTDAPASTFTSQHVKVLDNVRQVVGQGSSTYAVRTDGTLWAWGRNEESQLGLGDHVNRSVPTPVPGLINVVQVAAGAGTHAVALTADGKVWTMGSNCCGQLGWANPGSHPGDPRFYQSTPQLIADMNNVVAVAADHGATYLVRADGTLWVSGYNFTGSLGLGEVATNVGAPRRVQTLSGVTAVARGRDLSLALLQDGSVWGWGPNLTGQLGGLGGASEIAPIRLAFLSDVVAIAAGGGAGFALRRDGEVVTWGANVGGALGRGSIDVVMPPGSMAGPGGVGVFNVNAATPSSINRLPHLNLKITASGSQSPVTVTVTVDAGDGDGSVASIRLLATDGQSASISGTTGTATFRFDTAGSYRIDAIAVDNQGGAAIARGFPPLVVKTPSTVIDTQARIVTGFDDPIVLNRRGEVRTWGKGWVIGVDGAELAHRYSPALPPEYLTHAFDPRVHSVVDIESAPNGKFAVLQSGQVLAWGNNSQGALGLELGGWIGTPTLVPALAGIAQVAGGWSHTLALDSRGRVYAAGANDFGQLGLGDRSARLRFALLEAPTGIVQIAAGEWTSYALDSSGKVWAWGRNLSGQLGVGSTTDTPSPQPVGGLPPIARLFRAAHGAFAIARDGTVWGWGGVPLPDTNGSPPPYTSPILQPTLGGAVSLSAYYAVAMLKADGTVWTWGGGNQAPLLGDGVRTYRSMPAVVPGLANVKAISMSYQSALALRSDGTVAAWGNNFRGELGDGTFAQRIFPVLVVNETADGFLNLHPGTDFEVPPAIGVPFFVETTGAVSGNNASVATTTKFNAADAGKPGAVFVIASVPDGSPLGALQSSSLARSASRSTARNTASTSSFTLIQLTPSGWQPVVNGQLIPYSSGVLGDQLAAQAILANADTTTLPGSQFCLGYGTNADQMIATGAMRVVATIPDPNATSASTANCLLSGPAVSYGLPVAAGWNLLGNSLNQTIAVASLYGDANTVNTVWKWDSTTSGWQFYTPTLDAAALQAYAAANGYAVLTEIRPGEGYWVNAKAPLAIATQSGASFVTTSTNVAKGWNLSATGLDITPSVFNANLKANVSGTGVTSVWAWDAPSAKWYFYAPSLEAQGGSALANYIASKDYLDFTPANKTLGKGTGFWVNR